MLSMDASRSSLIQMRWPHVSATKKREDNGEDNGTGTFDSRGFIAGWKGTTEGKGGVRKKS